MVFSANKNSSYIVIFPEVKPIKQVNVDWIWIGWWWEGKGGVGSWQRMEDLNVKGMMKNHKLSKSIGDVSWGKFIETLTYKADWNDKKVEHIDRYFPSSKTCHKCGWINNGLELKDRKWTCGKCGFVHDRDLNAAINILNEGYRKNISGGTSEYKRRAKIRLSLGKSTGVETLKEKELI